MHSKELVVGMKLKTPATTNSMFEPCILGKHHRHAIPRGPAERKSQTLALIHMDLKGPLPVADAQGHRYWQTFICDASDYWAIAFLRKKSDAFEAFKCFKAYAEKFHGHKMAILATREDKGGEFIGKDFAAYCASEGITRQHTEPDEPHQNGIAERANRTIEEAVTTMLAEAKLPMSFWSIAVQAFLHVRNRCPSNPNPETTPHERWKHKKPDVSYFRVFGCLAYVHIKKKKRKALQPKSQKCVFIGYAEGTKAWKFWNPVTQKILVSSHAIFDEHVFPGNSHSITTITTSLSNPPDTETPDAFETPVTDQGGGDDSDLPPTPSESPHLSPHPSPINEPLSPTLPDVETPLLSPLTSTPPSPMLSDLSLSPSPPPQPKARVPLEPLIRSDGLIEPLPNTGRGFRRVKSTPGHRPPWNYHGAWPTKANNTPTATPTSDDEDDDDDDESAPKITGPDIINGMLSIEDHYVTYSEALECAFSMVVERVNKASAHGNEPKTLSEAMKRPKPEADLYYQAAVDEIHALIEHGVFELVKLPPGRKAIGSRWVFRVKRNADGSVERYKARLVAKGYAQRPGFDFMETFSPTPKWAAIRAVLALAALEDLELWSVDISSAFLNGVLKEEVYLEQPEGFREKDDTWVWRLIKSLYGLKQAGREWHLTLHDTLTEKMGFTRVKCEHSIWVYQRDSSRIIVPVFVDDMTIAAKNVDDARRIVEQLKLHFKLRDLGPTSFLLGVQIERDRENRKLSLSQRQYTLDILERASLSDCNTVTTPMDPNIKLSSTMSPSTPAEWEEMRGVPYINILGAVAYLAIATRPDIAYAVGVLARFSKNPGVQHWKALKHLLRYLRGTVDYKLTYAPSDSSNGELFTSYCDADHGGNPDNGRSTSGFIIKMGTGAISWASRLQPFVTLSTTEAEYVSAVSCAQEILWLRNLFMEFGYPITEPSTLHIDNQSAVSVAKNPDHHGRVKHLDLRFYWLRDEVAKGRIAVQHIPGVEMPADILTKALGKEKVLDMVNRLGLRH
ncbi:hypothetical protein HGRIS_014931 [Hohenbuehelia grisea]|uniref:Integrase catalytic domain-containing protein n=1 Tax=Hohenbuehelia grisea TaxID=104357 RepID=A0ABR3JYG1_9AGAR